MSSSAGGSAPQLTSAVDALARAIDELDFDAANEAVRGAWFELLHVHGAASRAALERVPLRQLAAHPLLAMLLGICYNSVDHRRAKAVQYFTLASAAMRTRGDRTSAADRVLILASESAALRLIGRAAAAAGPARAALRVLESMPAADRAETFSYLPRLYGQLGTSLYSSGDVEEAMDAFAIGLAETSDSGDGAGFTNVSMLAGIHAFDGDLLEADRDLAIARSAPWTDVQRSMYPGTFYRLAEAVRALERFDVAAAETHLAAMVHDRRTIEHWTAIARVEALTALAAGRPAEALARLEAFANARGGEGRSGAARSALASVRSLLHLAAGKPDAAQIIVQRDAPSTPQTHVDRARIELALARPGAALRELRAVAGVPQSTRTAAEAAALEAAVFLRLADPRRARSAIEHLCAALDVSGLRLPLALLQPSDLERVREAAAGLGRDGIFMDVAVRSLLVEISTGAVLSPRELAVLRALMNTASVAEIAAEAVVSVNTVKSQLRSIYRKLGARNREEAIAIAIDRHVLAAEE